MIRTMIALLFGAISVQAQATILAIPTAMPTTLPPGATWQTGHLVKAGDRHGGIRFGGSAATTDVRLGMKSPETRDAAYAVELPYGDAALMSSGLLFMGVTSGNCCTSILTDFEQRSDPAVIMLAYGRGFAADEMKTSGNRTIRAALPVLAIGMIILVAGLRSRRAAQV